MTEVHESVSIAIESCTLDWSTSRDFCRSDIHLVDEFCATLLIKLIRHIYSGIYQLYFDMIFHSISYFYHGDRANTIGAV